MGFYSQDTFRKLLDTYKDSSKKAQGYKAQPWQTSVPQELDTDTTNKNSFYNQLQSSVLDNSREATSTSLVMAQNKANLQALQEMRQRKQNAQANFIKQKQQQTIHLGGGPSLGGSDIPTTGFTGQGGNWGPNGIPQVSDLAHLKPHSPIVSVNWRGHSFQTNQQVAPIFVAFLNALWKTGYRPKVIGGYANRNIAGTSTPSLHSYGFAIDIDPSRNPVTWDGHNVTALPPGVGALAARYGLRWGGSWHGSKRDTMHFSVPYGGTL